jgi:hypothetical protein
VPIPEFKKSRVLQLIAGIARKWGGADKVRELEATLRAVADPQDYLRRVASLGPAAAENLVAAAVLGISVAAATEELVRGGSASTPRGGELSP